MDGGVHGGRWMRGALGAAGTMMPGETQLPPAGTAAAAVPCKNCGVLQQVAMVRGPCSAGVLGRVFA